MIKYYKGKLPMKKIPALALLATCLCLTGCNHDQKPNPGPDPLPEDVVEVRLPHNMNDKAQDYNIHLRFDDEFFKEDAREFDKELALLSLGSTFTTCSSIFIGQFYDRLGFDTVNYFNYSVTPTENTIGYSIAHKKIGESDLLAIAVRGFNYGKEWSNNFLMGETGNHEGFQSRSDEIYASLKATIETNNYQNLKLWITGYSRGGGVSNVLSRQILIEEEIDIEQEDMFVYTFEAPRGLTEENAIAYENVHNLINNADIVTYIAPQEYGLYRCGIDHQIYSARNNLGRLLYDLDKDINLPTFTPTSDYANEQECIQWMISSLTREMDTSDPDNAAETAHTRQDFVNNYQDGVRYMIGLFFSLSSSTTNKLMKKLENSTLTEKAALLSTDGIYNFVKPVLDEDHVPYVDEELHTNCNVMTKFLQHNASILLSVMMSDAGMESLKHIIYMHMPEAEYVLLKNLQLD